MSRIPAPASNVRVDYAVSGRKARNEIYRKARALRRAQASRVLCAAAVPADFDKATQERIWRAIQARIAGTPVRLAEDCQ